MLTHDKDTGDIFKGDNSILQTRFRLRGTNYNIYKERT
jgi:hypothetical protein